MHGNIVMIEDQEGEKRKLNKREPQINRGFELMLRQHNRREKPSKPKSFLIRFGKMISLLRREIHFQFELFLDIKKK
jgi:hypothetical protein